MKPTNVLKLEEKPPYLLRVIEDERLIYRTSLDSVESIEQVIVGIDRILDYHLSIRSNLDVILRPVEGTAAEKDAAGNEGWSEWSFDEDSGMDFDHFCGDVCFMLDDESQAKRFYEQALMCDTEPVLEAKLLWLRCEKVEEPEEDDDEDVLPRHRKSNACRDVVARFLIHRGGFRLNQTFFSGAALDFKKAIEIWPDCIADVRAAASAWAAAGFPKQASVLEQVVLDAS